MFHKEGSKIIFITLLLVVGVIFLSDAFITIEWIKAILIVIALFFLVMILQFFRNPKREIDNSDNHILLQLMEK